LYQRVGWKGNGIDLPRLMYPIIVEPSRNGVAGSICFLAPGIIKADRENGIQAKRLKIKVKI
jgi:hypothetical protein